MSKELYPHTCYVVDSETVVVQGMRFVKERTCEGCVFDGLYANNCAFCNRDPRLTDQFMAKVVK